MNTLSIARRILLESPAETAVELSRAGTGLENPYVFHEAALEIKAAAARGRARIVEETVGATGTDTLVTSLKFVRVG